MTNSIFSLCQWSEKLFLSNEKSFCLINSLYILGVTSLLSHKKYQYLIKSLNKLKVLFFQTILYLNQNVQM